MKETNHLLATALTPCVRQWLEKPKAISILHIFDEVINLINADGDIISVVQVNIRPGPFSIVVKEERPFPTLIHPYAQVAKTETVLRIGPLEIDCSREELWHPIPNWQRLQQNQTDLAWLASDIQTAVQKRLDFMGSIGPANFMQQFEAAIAEMEAAIFEPDPASWQTAVTKLAGLGPGFTPAGDDFLVGFLLGLWATRSAEEVLELAKIVVETAVPRTTKLSAAWLQAAGRGEAWIAWHGLVDSFIAGYGWRLPVKLILERGATSGVAALLGFVTAVSSNPA